MVRAISSLPSPLFSGPSNSGSYAIRCLVPNLPKTQELIPYLQRIDENRWYSNFGPLVLEYETRLGELTGGNCVTLSSATAALELGIAALGLPQGSRVLVPAFAFPASLLAVLRCGLQPVLCDVCADTWTLTPGIALAALGNDDVKLVVPVATFGQPLPVEAWDRFARTTGVAVLMDAAAALGQQKVSELVNAVFSLHATKPLGIGEGGVFATADANLAERVRRMTNYGFVHHRVTYAGGTNAKLSEYAAAVGLAQLDRSAHLLTLRQSIRRKYGAALDQLPGVRAQAGSEQIAPAVFSVSLGVDASHVAAAMSARGIETRRWYLPPLHHHPLFAELDRWGPGGGTSLPTTENMARHSLGLPFHTYLADDEIALVSNVVADYATTAIERG
jgi:dTDP-4-amino-4,6-dideoxygalactose transaminase